MIAKEPNQPPEPRRRRDYGRHGNTPATFVTIRASAFGRDFGEAGIAWLTQSASVALAVAELWRGRHL